MQCQNQISTPGDDPYSRILSKNDISYLARYNFVFDRLRSIRQDAVIQRSEEPEIITILEQAIRFHHLSSYRLCEQSMGDFDTKICNDHMNECLSRLLLFYQFYPNLCRNQVEFQSLYLLCNLGSTNAAMHILSLPVKIRKHPRIQLALHLNRAYLEHNFVRFIRLIEKCNYIESCALLKYRTSFLILSLETMNTAYHSKVLTFPACVLSNWLGFDSAHQALCFCQECGLTIKDNSVCFTKGAMKERSKMKHKRTFSQKFVDCKLKKRSPPDIIRGLEININETEKPPVDMWNYVN
ncbi:SAC3 domain-containing protein 1-like isoform X2 [Antedon mediterranea]|uniref:SAC3 domain-containing protein 1-like isoform X2 n=1 Tax=Antedon mediterranea TaxID=105859 RepID=UPI003AF47FA4